MNNIEVASVQVVRFSPKLSTISESLNREWIDQYFDLEEQDLHVFRDPFKNIGVEAL